MKVFGTKQKDRLLEDILNAREISVRHKQCDGGSSPSL